MQLKLSSLILSNTTMSTWQKFKSAKDSHNKTCVINDPLGQTHSLVGSDHYFLLFVLLDLKSGDGRTDVQNIMITTSRDCGSAEWIKIEFVHSDKSVYFITQRPNTFLIARSTSCGLGTLKNRTEICKSLQGCKGRCFQNDFSSLF